MGNSTAILGEMNQYTAIVWQAFFTAIVTIVIAWMQLKTKQAVEKSGDATKKAVVDTGKAAAVKAEAVKDSLDEHNVGANQKLDMIAGTTQATLGYVNSAYGAQLELQVKTAKALVAVKPTPENQELLRAAEEAYAKHVRRQAFVDQFPHEGGTPPVEAGT
jgi:hypothetical protein